MSGSPSGALHLSRNDSDAVLDADVRIVPDFTQPPQIGFEGYGGGIDLGDGPTATEPPDRTPEERLAAHLARIPAPDPPGTSRWPDGSLATDFGGAPVFAGVSMPDDPPPPNPPARLAISRRPVCSRPRERRSRVTRKQRAQRRAGSSRGDPDPDPESGGDAESVLSGSDGPRPINSGDGDGAGVW